MNVVVSGLEYRMGHEVSRLVTHDHVLHGESVKLRPMTEGDWGILLAWNNDSEVMEYVDSGGFSPSSLSEIQSIYRWISTHAFCFIMEVDGRAVGECWLQRMNLRRIVEQFPDDDLWRIDLMIGVKDLWGRGFGSEAIKLLVQFGFGRVGADAIFGLVSASNTRSRRAFQKCGFAVLGEPREPVGATGYDLVITSRTASSG